MRRMWRANLSRYPDLDRRFDAEPRRLPGDAKLAVRLEVEPNLG